jgi:hypothetical protein
MPAVSKPDNHKGDGISLTGDEFDFTDFSENEMSLEGVMFYSIDPASHGYVLTSDGHAVRKSASDSPMSSATASSIATASPLPSSGGTPLVSVPSLVATLALVGSGAAIVVLLRRDPS